MSLTSRFGIGLTFGLLLSLSTPFIIPAISHNSSIAISQAQTQPTQTQPTQTQSTSFSDVPADYWAQDYIAGLTKLNIISGFGDGTFRPDEPVTRAQFAAILRKAFLQSQPTTAKPFADVPSKYWATDAIYAARSAGFLSGYPGNRFAPNEPIKRRDALVSLASGLKYADAGPEALDDYWDANDNWAWYSVPSTPIPSYALPKIRAAAKANIIVSYPSVDLLSLNDFTRRADVAAFVYQALVKAGRAEPLAAQNRWHIKPSVRLPIVSTHMSLSQTGQQLATIPSDGADGSNRFQIWNTQTGQLIKEVKAPAQTRFDSVTISHDGKQAATISILPSTDAMQLSIWTVATGEPLWKKNLETPPPQPWAVNSPGFSLSYVQAAFSPDNGEIAIQLLLAPQSDSPASSQIRLYQAATGKIVQSLDTSAVGIAGVRKIIYSPDGQFLAIAQSGTAAVWQRNKGNQFEFFKELPVPEGASQFLDMVFTDGSTLNISTLIGEGYSATARLDVWNIQTDRQPSRTVATDWFANDSFSRLSPDDKNYFVQGFIGGSRLKSSLQPELSQSLQNDDFISAVVFSEDGNRLAIATYKSTSVFTKKTISNP